MRESTNMEADVSPRAFNIVAGASVIVAIIVRIGNAAVGNPSNVMIKSSEIVPPPTGTALINKVAIKLTVIICHMDILLINK